MKKAILVAVAALVVVAVLTTGGRKYGIRHHSQMDIVDIPNNEDAIRVYPTKWSGAADSYTFYFGSAGNSQSPNITLVFSNGTRDTLNMLRVQQYMSTGQLDFYGPPVDTFIVTTENNTFGYIVMYRR